MIIVSLPSTPNYICGVLMPHSSSFKFSVYHSSITPKYGPMDGSFAASKIRRPKKSAIELPFRPETVLPCPRSPCGRPPGRARSGAGTPWRSRARSRRWSAESRTARSALMERGKNEGTLLWWRGRKIRLVGGGLRELWFNDCMDIKSLNLLVFLHLHPSIFLPVTLLVTSKTC